MSYTPRRIRLATVTLTTLLVLGLPTWALADPLKILFVGNSYTFGRVDPVLHYNAANVHDLTSPDQGGSFTNTNGSNPYEPHNWGGVAGLFKQFTVQAGLNYDVSISARNAATFRGQYLNSNPANWDMLGNIASQKWDSVVLQDQSDEPLPNLKGANANLALFNFYANKLEDYIHTGIKAGAETGADVLTTTESIMMGSTALPTATPAQRAAACIAFTGGASNPNSLSQTACNTTRNIKGNANESTATNVYLYETWARPDAIYAHTNIVIDPTTGVVSTGSGAATLYQDSLESMTSDLHNAYFGLAASNTDFKGVAPVGDAFLRAVQSGIATRNPYAADAASDGLMDLWFDDNLHASKWGSYLSALTLYGTITGLDPSKLGAGEIAARDLGISSADAVALQRIASAQLGFADVPEPATGALVLAAGLAALAVRRRSAPARH